MIIRIPIKEVIIVGSVIVVGFWILGKIGDNKSISSPVSPSFSQNQNSKNILTDEIREIEVTVRQFSFNPNPIKVNLGETIRLKIKSIDVAHGFALPEFNIDEALEPGKTVSVQFQATRKGSFQFFCSIICGAGHSGMRGTLIVE